MRESLKISLSGWNDLEGLECAQCSCPLMVRVAFKDTIEDVLPRKL